MEKPERGLVGKKWIMDNRTDVRLAALRDMLVLSDILFFHLCLHPWQEAISLLRAVFYIGFYIGYTQSSDTASNLGSMEETENRKRNHRESNGSAECAPIKSRIKVLSYYE